MRRAAFADIPVNDWIALGFLIWMLTMVGWSVQLANWGDLPNIAPTAIIAAAIAFFASRTRTTQSTAYSGAQSRWTLLTKFALFLVAGVVVVFWQGSLNAEGGNPIARSVDAWDRFGIWIDIAFNGGVSADQIPFAMLMMTFAWILSYVVTALTFRFHSPWIPALMLGLALLTNLSHRIGEHEQTFYLFMFGAVAQFAHLVAIGRINQWRQSGLTFPQEARWIAARDGLILGFVVMIIAALLPLVLPRSEPLSDRWNTIFLDPITQFRDTAERLLAGVPSGDDDLIYSPNSILPFQGGIQLTDDPVMWIRSRYAKLHPARVYQEYTSQGWLTAPSVALPANAGTKLLVNPIENGITERARIDIAVEPLGKTDLVIPAAAVYAIDYQADIEVLEPLAWDVPLAGSPAKLADLPVDLREFAFMLREQLREMAEVSPIYSPPDSANDRPPFTLNTQPAMTADEVSTVIRQMQSATTPITNEEEQITYSITSSSLEEMNLTNSGEFVDMTFVVSQTALSEMLSKSDNTPDTLGIRVSTLTLKEQADNNGGVGPKTLEFVVTPRNLESLAIADLDPLGSPNPPDSTRFNVTATDIENMDLSRSGVAWETFSYRVFAEPDGTNANLMRLVRRGPTEQNTVTFDQIIEQNQRYNVTTYISTAENAELAASTDAYPDWVTDRYLHLPESIPIEVGALARKIVDDAAAVTPWEKTLAIKAWLKQQVYSLEIEGPGPRDDAVYYFLFKTVNEPCPSDFPNCDQAKRKGYSQYFGSTATVLLRYVGVPARMIAGWSIGEYVPEQGQFLIRDRNRHGWTQIFAPPYGWIDIEVTPGRPSVPRNVRVPTSPTTGMPPELPSSAEFDPDFLQYLEDLDDLALLEQEFLASGRFNNEAGNQPIFDIPIVPTASIAAIIAIILLIVIAWRWNLRGQPEAVRTYSQFIRVASVLGYRRPSHASVREFANQIGDMTGRYVDARTITDAFEKTVYGPPATEIIDDTPGVEHSEIIETSPIDLSDTDPTDNGTSVVESAPMGPDLGNAWRSLARGMLRHRLLSMFGMTPPYAADEPQEQYRFTT